MRYARSGKHPVKTLLLLFVALSPLHAFFFLHPLQIESDVRRGFADAEGKSAAEFKRFAEFFGVPFRGLEIWVVLVKPKESLQSIPVDEPLLRELQRLDSFVKNFSTPFGGGLAHFKDTWSGEELNKLLSYLNDYTSLVGFADIGYPIMSAFGHELDIATHFFGVNKLGRPPSQQQQQHESLNTTQYVALWYMSKATNYTEKKMLEAVEYGLYSYFLEDTFSPLFSVAMFGDQIANAEMLRGTAISLGLFVVGAVFMICFMLQRFSYLTWPSRIWMTIGAMLSPILATWSTFSLTGWLGVEFNSIMCITPFLVLGIGVDDAFLLLHQWKRVRASGVLQPREALKLTILHVGPSMAITSITNTVAFGIGFLNPAPQMSAFCLGTALAILLDFVYEFLVFATIMVMVYDERKISASENDLRKSESTYEEYIIWSTSEYSVPDLGPELSTLSIWKRVIEILYSTSGRVIVISLCVVMYITAVLGLSKMKPSFEPAKTFPADSDLIHALRSFEEVQLEYWPTNYVSRSVPRTWEAVAEWNMMIEQIEHQAHCYGRQRTINFLRAFFEQPSDARGAVDFSPLPRFLEDAMVADRKIIQYETDSNGTVSVLGANFVVVCRGETDWNRRAAVVHQTRRLIDAHAQFNTSLFDYDATIYDIIISVKSELIHAVLITFVCMSIISALSIPSFADASLASLAMLSVSGCMLGFLSLWGCQLDPIVMINVLMAIGFSVDFSAHICYHHHLAKISASGETEKERLTRVLQAVGQPMIEASLSTIFCMLPLFVVNIYVITSFAKTVCLVASLGLFHGIIIIPLIFSLLPNGCTNNQ